MAYTKFKMIVAIGALAAVAASGETAAQESGNVNYAIEEIIVTATKRAESIQDVPMSVSAFSGDELRDAGVTSSMEVASKVPNVQFRSAWGFSVPQFYIRGLGNRNFQTNAISPVAVYLDGVVMGSGLSQTFQLFDLERVEVLRGPQGTLFGRNSSAGLLNFISKKPDPKAGLSGEIVAGYGRFNQAGVETGVNVPLSDEFAMRLAVKVDRRDGFFDDATGALGRDLGDTQSHQFRGTLGYFGDEVEALVRVRGGELDNDQRPWKQVGTEGTECPIVGLNQQCTDFFGFSDSSDPFESFLKFIGEESNEAFGVDVQVTWDISDNLSLVYIGAYDDASNFRFVDEDFAPSAVLHTTYDSEVSFTSHELRMLSDNPGRLNWIAGLYLYADDMEQWYGASLPDLGLGLGQILTQETLSYAIYGNIEYDISDTLKLRSGVRVTYDRREGASQSFAFDPSPFVTEPTHRGLLSDSFGDVAPFAALKESWTKPSGQVSLSYEPNSDLHFYGSYMRGFKGGDFNGGLFSAVETVLVDPEFVDNFEVGLKSYLLDGRLGLNLTLFTMKVKDQQVSSIQNIGGLPALVLSNAAESELEGVEGEFTFRITNAFSVTGAFGLLDAKFKHYPDANPAGDDFSGNRLAYAPKFTVNANIRYEKELSSGLIAMDVGMRKVGKMYDQPENNPVFIVEDYVTADAYVSYMPLNDKWNVRVWIKNLADNDYYTAFFAGGGLGYNALGYADPRTYGVTVGYRFD